MKVLIGVLLTAFFSTALSSSFTIISLNGIDMQQKNYNLTITDVAMRGQVYQQLTLNFCKQISIIGSFQGHQFFRTKDPISVTNLPSCQFDDGEEPTVEAIQNMWSKAFYYTINRTVLRFYTPQHFSIMVFQAITDSISFSIFGNWNVVDGKQNSNKVTIEDNTIKAASVTYNFTLTGLQINTTKIDKQNLCQSTAAYFCSPMDAVKFIKVYSLKHWCFWSDVEGCLLQLSLQ